MYQTKNQTRYERLRKELENAYTAPVWNSQLIDLIADEISKLERAFAFRARHGDSALSAVKLTEAM